MASIPQRPRPTPADADNSTANSSREGFEKLLDSYAQPAPLREGEMLKGRVLRIRENEVIVDVGYKCEGLIPIAQVRDRDGNLAVREGAVIDVAVERSAEREGYVLLSFEKAQRYRVWEDIEKAFNEGTPITGRVADRIKGGLMVDVGVKAFLPGSQVDVKPIRNLDALKGQEIQVKVIKFNRKRGNVVVSRKMLVEAELNARKAVTLASLAEGAVVRGVIKNLTEYGAFVDLGGLDGLLHITDMSWGRVAHPSEIVQAGEEVDLLVLKFDREKERVALGLKQLYPDPWHDAEHKFPPGTRIRGKVVNVTDYGAFVELEPGVEGLVHVSEMSWSKRLKHPSKFVHPGDMVEVEVLEVHPHERRISLSLRQTEPNPWTTLSDRYHVGAKVEGKVRNLTEFGAFIEIEDGIDGLVHVSDMSWTRRVKHPSEMLKKGDKVEAIVLAIDGDNRRLSLGIKQLTPDAWETFFQKYRVGDVVRGKVVRTASFGAFVELIPGVEGLCHISETTGERDQQRGGRRAPAPKEQPALAVGVELDFKIIKLNPGERKIGLSLRAVGQDMERRELDEYLQQQRGAGATSTLEEMVSLKERGGPEGQD
jgi:small subunit ribosomal protein S1